MRAPRMRTPRVLTFSLVLVVLTTAILPATASAAGAALTLPPLAPVPGTTCTRPPEIALSVDSDLRVPSGISAWAIDRFLAAATPLPPLGAAFKLAEARYGVNALYLLAHAMLESDFGRSYIARTFHNLFGWTAYDRDPLAFATRFPTDESSIDYVALQISRLYLDPDGIHYGGAPTLRGMHRYASDPLWESSIARIANSLCLATLAGSGITFSSTLASGSLGPGDSTDLTIEASDATALPDGLRLAARARRLGEDAPASNDIATYSLTPAVSEGGVFRLPLQAGTLPGAYTLDFVLLDSDGGLLPAADQVPIPPVSLEVVAAQALTYSVRQTSLGLIVSIASVGRAAIPAGPGDRGATIEVRYLAAGDGVRGGDAGLGVAGPVNPSLIATFRFNEPLAPGASRGFQLPLSGGLDLPGVLFVQARVTDGAGQPLELGSGSFRITRDTNSIGAGVTGRGGDVLVITALRAGLPTAGE